MSLDVRKSHLLSQVQEFYGVGPSFAEAYIDYWFRSTDKRYADLAEILASRPPKPMWFDFALSSNQRGEQIYQRIVSHFPNSRRRYLDVGCGFGGFLVAFSKYGFEVKGMEIDPIRIELAEANCRDHRLQDCVFEASILDDDLSDELGSFDVITCNDVIEHVADASRAIENMARLLNPGGVLFMEIPNKDSVHFVASDGHFELFGITLLDRQDAVAYHQSRFNDEYDVGEYFPLKSYWSSLRAVGCEPGLLPPADASRLRFEQVVRSVAEALGSYFSLLLNRPSGIPGSVRRKLRIRFLRYMGSFLLGLVPSIVSRRQRESYRLRYLTDFWSLLAHKGG